MIIALLVGFISGWMISMPIGPVNAAAISRTIHYNRIQGFLVGAGAAVMDMIYCGGATQINAFLLRSPIVNLGFLVIGFALMLYLGIKSLREEASDHPFEPTISDTKRELKAEARVGRMNVSEASAIASLALGIVLYASNVAGIPEWIFISAFWHNQGVSVTGYTDALTFAIGAGLGTAGWFLTVTRFFSRRKRSLKPRTMHLINRVAGFAMLAFGVYFGYQIVFKTDWNQVHEHWQEHVKQTLGFL